MGAPSIYDIVWCSLQYWFVLRVLWGVWDLEKGERFSSELGDLLGSEILEGVRCYSGCRFGWAVGRGVRWLICKLKFRIHTHGLSLAVVVVVVPLAKLNYNLIYMLNMCPFAYPSIRVYEISKYVCVQL